MRIVLVAEPGFLRSSAQVNLPNEGHQLEVAEPADLLEVLTLLRAQLPERVVLDAVMHGCSCETLVRIIREDPVLARTPILVLAEHPGGDAAVRMERWPGVRVMQKAEGVHGLLREVAQFPPVHR